VIEQSNGESESRTTDQQVAYASTEGAVRRCWPVFRELRLNITSETEFIERWKIQSNEGYKVVFIESDGVVVAIGGYRLLNNMAWGQILYLDDLAALSSEHGKGFGTAILRHVQDEARRLGCDGVHLDTGYHRHKAHRSYLRNGFELDSHHLSWKVDPA